MSPFPGNDSTVAHCGYAAQSKGGGVKRKKGSLVRRVPAVLLINYCFPQEHHAEINNPKVTNVVLGKANVNCP